MLALVLSRANRGKSASGTVVLLAFATTRSFPWTAWPFALALPAGWCIYAFSPEQAGVIDLPTLFFTLGAALIIGRGTFLFNNRAGSRKVTVQC